MATTSTTLGAHGSVTIKGFRYAPDPITVTVGASVTWTNEDFVGHTATASDDSFHTELLTSGRSATIAFATVGSFSYFCTPHPAMVGTVIVLPAA